MSNSKKCNFSRRAMMVYFVMFLWTAFAVFIEVYQPNAVNGVIPTRVSYTSMAVYFMSLTGFVGSYLYGATMKPSENTTPMFMKGKTDKRERIVYMSILLWTAVGIYAMIKGIPLEQIGTYFGALTPFVGGYIFGETHRSSTEVVAPVLTPGADVKKEDVKTDETQVDATQEEDEFKAK